MSDEIRIWFEYLEFISLFLFRNHVALSLCGGLDFGGPTDKEFDEHLIDYTEVTTFDLILFFFCVRVYELLLHASDQFGIFNS